MVAGQVTAVGPGGSLAPGTRRDRDLRRAPRWCCRPAPTANDGNGNGNGNGNNGNGNGKATGNGNDDEDDD